MLKPRLVTEFSEFVKILPQAVKAFADSFARWSREKDDRTLIAELVERFKEPNEFYCELLPNGEISYFFVILKFPPDLINFWVIYVNPASRDLTKPYVDYVLSKYKEEGYTLVEFSTTRLTSSYKRWADKFGAKPFSMTYHINLQEN